MPKMAQAAGNGRRSLGNYRLDTQTHRRWTLGWRTFLLVSELARLAGCTTAAGICWKEVWREMLECWNLQGKKSSAVHSGYTGGTNEYDSERENGWHEAKVATLRVTSLLWGRGVGCGG